MKNARREICYFTRNSYSADMTAIGDKLQGAKVIHNHPDSKDYYGDCFSMNDFSTFFEYQLKRLEVVSGLGRYIMEYDGGFITKENAKIKHIESGDKVLTNAMKTSKAIQYKQLGIMNLLNKTIQGLRFKKVKP